MIFEMNPLTKAFDISRPASESKEMVVVQCAVTGLALYQK